MTAPSSPIMRALAGIGRQPLRRLVLSGLGLVALMHVSLLALAAESHRISQKGRAFDMKEITIAAGDSLQFGNDDEFIHQIYVQSPTFNFDSEESSPGDTIPLKFTARGTFEVHCHIHPKMRLVVTVQ